MKAFLVLWLMATGVAFANGVTKKSDFVVVHEAAAGAIKTLVTDGKASYRFTDAQGVTWRVTVTPLKNKEAAR
jgi:hypothetical protein